MLTRSDMNPVLSQCYCSRQSLSYY